MENTNQSNTETKDRIRGWRDRREAVKLTWLRQKGHLFTSWVHVPLGVMSMLVVTWAFRLVIDQAPFRFPAPVIAMILFFITLLALDWLSLTFPGQISQDTEKGKHDSPRKSSRRRFVDPFMALLAPPCEFCLRNMSVMFTPSFVLIPARELIPGKEIGLITAWFIISQVLAFVFPVVFLWAIDWMAGIAKKTSNRNRKEEEAPPFDQSRRASTATLSGVDWEKGFSFSGGHKLGPVATGLSGLTATVIAPVSHLSMDIDADAWRQFESTALEQARQQGETALFTYRNYLPRSDVSTFRHAHQSQQHSIRPTLHQAFDGRSKTDPLGLPLAEYRFPATRPSVTQDDIQITNIESNAETRVNSRNTSQADVLSETRRGSRVTFDLPINGEARKESTVMPDGDSQVKQKDFIQEPSPSSDNDSDDNNDDNAIERLSSWISDLITPFIYFILFLVGIPLYFVLDIALPLFLAINLLTFIAAITIVPPKIRRFLHPILSCSVATVLLIWAFGAMRGIGLKSNLNRFYSVNAGYLELWSLSGYHGPVPGAGDVLFSTLDAGIVALAVPMYRYRKELKANFLKMIMVLTPCAMLSLFFWNWIASLMGMDQVRSLAFTARFMSTPLAIELAGNIGADESITVILVVLTGIVAAILKDHFFKFMHVDREDHLIVGITMGSTSGAIGASSLINTPKVMAVASLSFVIFGSILLIATAIPPIVDIVRILA